MALLVTTGWPALDAEWVRAGPACEWPRYVTPDGALALAHASGAWCVVEVARGHVRARAASFALHPHTVRQGEWHDAATGRVLAHFHVGLAPGVGASPAAPADLRDLGLDVFARVRLRRVLWYRDPATGAVESSYTKRPGRRYCHLCGACFSANNFSAQHLRDMHRAPEVLRCVRDVQHAMLAKEADGAAPW